jgi:uncharacterized protein (DUF2062 family)
LGRFRENLRSMEDLLKRRVLQPILDLLRQGVTPEKIALSIALGAMVGIFPALGWATILGVIAALLLRLNLPIIQLVNYLMYPLQIALLLPFFRLGEKLFNAPHLPISAPQILAMSKTNLQATVKLLWSTTWHAMVVWVLFAPVAVALAYFLLVRLLRRALRQSQSAAAAAS